MSRTGSSAYCDLFTGVALVVIVAVAVMVVLLMDRSRIVCHQECTRFAVV